MAVVVVVSCCDFLDVDISGPDMISQNGQRYSFNVFMNFYIEKYNFHFMSTLSSIGANETPVLLHKGIYNWRFAYDHMNPPINPYVILILEIHLKLL